MDLSFESWKHLLGDTEIDSNDGGIAWKQSWRNKPLAALRSSDFEMAIGNQAISGATDNTDVGADISVVRSTPESSNSADVLPPGNP